MALFSKKKEREKDTIVTRSNINGLLGSSPTSKELEWQICSKCTFFRLEKRLAKYTQSTDLTREAYNKFETQDSEKWSSKNQEVAQEMWSGEELLWWIAQKIFFM